MEGLDKKKSIIFYYDWFDALDELDPASAWKIIRRLRDADENPDGYDISDFSSIETALFKVMVGVVTANKRKYIKACEAHAASGAKGGRPRKEQAEGPADSGNKPGDIHEDITRNVKSAPNSLPAIGYEDISDEELPFA